MCTSKAQVLLLYACIRSTHEWYYIYMYIAVAVQPIAYRRIEHVLRQVHVAEEAVCSSY
jgi:hypothetical protein